MLKLLLSILSKVPGLLAGPVSKFLTGINISQVLEGAGKFFGLVFNNIKAHWRYYLPVVLVGAQLATCYGWHRDHDLLLRERAAHQLDITNFKKAQADADTKAQAEKSTLQKEAKADADQADASYSTLLAEYRANLLRYKASQSATSSTNHNQLPPAQSSDGPSTGSEVSSISISLEDAGTCATNTARLQAVHDWAMEELKSNANAENPNP